MGSIFTEHVFPRYVGRQVMKPQMNGFNDPTLRDFSLLDSSVLMKEKLKGEMFEEEFIRWALESREETLKGVWLTGEILSPRALKKHITAKLDLLDRLDMLKTEGDA